MRAESGRRCGMARRVGRPSREVEAVRVNFHMEKDLYDTILLRKGEDETVTHYLNKMIREYLENKST